MTEGSEVTAKELAWRNARLSLSQIKPKEETQPKLPPSTTSYMQNLMQFGPPQPNFGVPPPRYFLNDYIIKNFILLFFIFTGWILVHIQSTIIQLCFDVRLHPDSPRIKG